VSLSKSAYVRLVYAQAVTMWSQLFCINVRWSSAEIHSKEAVRF